MDALLHARSSAARFGGEPEEYLAIHEWIDESSAHFNDIRHRAMRHHSLGVQEAVQKFGRTLLLQCQKRVMVKQIAERHIREDLGYIPTVADWLRHIKSEPWMRIPQHRVIKL